MQLMTLILAHESQLIKVFKGESVRQSVPVSLRRVITLKALSRKPFETIIYRINKY